MRGGPGSVGISFSDAAEFFNRADDHRRRHSAASRRHEMGLPSGVRLGESTNRQMHGFDSGIGLRVRVNSPHAAIDFVVKPQGEYVFFEIKPNWKFGGQLDSRKMPLYETFADLLIAGKASWAS